MFVSLSIYFICPCMQILCHCASTFVLIEQAIQAMGSLPMSRAMELFKEVEEKAVPLKNKLAEERKEFTHV